MRFHLIFCWRKATHKTIVCSKEILKQVLHRAIPRCFFECPVNYKKVTIMYYFQFTFERIIKGLFINNISIVQVPVHSGPSTDDPLSVCAHCSTLFLCKFSVFHCDNLCFFHVVFFSCCTFHTASFPCCSSFRVDFFFSSFYVFHYFMLHFYTLQCFCFTFFSCCTLRILRFFPVTLVHVSLFPEV